MARSPRPRSKRPVGKNAIDQANYNYKACCQSRGRDTQSTRAQSKYDRPGDRVREGVSEEGASELRWERGRGDGNYQVMDGGVSAGTSILGRDKSVQRPEDGPLMFPEPHTKTDFVLLNGHVGIHQACQGFEKERWPVRLEHGEQGGEGVGRARPHGAP